MVKKNPPGNAGDMRCGFDPWVGKIVGGGHEKPLQYTYLENPMERRAWRATIHGVSESGMTGET